MREIRLPETLVKIEAEAFAKCTSLEIIEASPVLKIIEERAFWGCLALKEISFPASLKVVGKEVFRDCIALQTVLFANSRIKLKSGVFSGCDTLETVVLPDGTHTFATRNLKWGVPSSARLLTHKELSAAEELLQKALQTPIEEADESSPEDAVE